MQRPLTAMGRRARSCPSGLWPPVQSGRLRSLARSLWQKRWPRSGAEAMCSVGPTMFAGCLQRPLRAEHFPQRAPAGRLLLGRNGGSLLPRLRKREGLPPREGVSCGGARPPPPLPGEKGPFCRQMAHGRSAALPEGRGRPQHPFLPVHSGHPRTFGDGRCAYRPFSAFPPFLEGRKAALLGGGFSQGRVRGRSALCTPGAAPQKGGRLPLPSG